MQRPFRETKLNITQRSREMLVGLTKKTQALFAVSSEQENTEHIEILDKGTQRLAQTRFGHLLLDWSKPRKKRRNKRRIPVFNLIFLAFVLVMVAISLLGNHQTASAASATTTAKVARAAAAGPPTNNGPAGDGKCLDGSALDSNYLCPPSSFSIDQCNLDKISRGTPPSVATDPCNPWGEYSNYTRADKSSLASQWEGMNVHDQECNYSKGSNADLSWSYDSSRNNGDPSIGGIGDTGSNLCVQTTTTNSTFPCTQTESDVQLDWLSGDPSAVSNAEPGHLATTYDQDTIQQGSVQTVYGYMLAVGFLLLIPGIILSGYKLIISGSSFRHAEALAILPRIFLAAAAVAACYYIITMLIGFSNDVSTSVVDLHNVLPYTASQAVTNSDGSVSYYIGYTLVEDTNMNIVESPGTNSSNSTTIEPNTSYRGIVVPINRWGCAANDFVSILTKTFWTNVFASFIPFFGNFINLAEKVTSAIGIVHHLGEFIQAILSIGLAGQVIFRIIMINFYILTGPLACGCWALPGDTGQGIFGQWLKGLFSLLLTQAVQLFILTVTPLIMPNFGMMHIPIDNMGLLQSIFSALPAIIVLFIALQVPRFIGTSATKAVAAAGTMASGAVAAGAAAAYSITQ